MNWINKAIALEIHVSLINKFGGADGIRDDSLLESALARPQQLFHYQSTSILKLAANYAYGIIKIIRLLTAINAQDLS